MLSNVPSPNYEDDDQAVDQEWEDWMRLVAQRQREQTFYPSPLVREQDGDGGAPPMPVAAMYGRYSRQLGEYARDEGARFRAQQQQQQQQQKKKLKRRGSLDIINNITTGANKRKHSAVAGTCAFLWQRTFARLGEDWVFLALLGVIMAVLSFAMDQGISACNNARLWLYRDLTNAPWAQYLAWITLPVCLVLFSAGFVHLIAPQSIGSGIPEMKTILRGVALKEYLTFRTLVAKVIGLTATLGSGMPLGKEGPFVHIASIVATLLGRLVTGFQGIYANEGRNTEMLAAACAVGVAACFAAPVGGVLFSIEVTTVYFAVRNYWRAFFAAVCGATVFRLLAVWFDRADTVTAVFRTGFSMDFPFDPQELVAFAAMGALCGLGGALYVRVHRRYVALMRSSRRLNEFLQQNRFLYPGLLALIVSTVSFPGGLGQFFAADLNTHDQVTSLFSNFTWTASSLSVEERDIVHHWIAPPYAGVFITLNAFAAFTFIFSIITSTLPVPSGSFIPVFKIGAALGRVVGEAMHHLFPLGLRYGGRIATIVPGGYAAVGAAAFSGAVTRTISVSVIVFEMTGQITHLVPMMIAVLVSNAVAGLLGPSIYDSIILIKRLPYLPDLLPASGAGAYDLCVEDFMVRDVKYVYKGITYKELKNVLLSARRLRSFPLVDNPDSMVLLGSVRRPDLISLVERQVGRERRLQVAAERQREKQQQQQRKLSRFRVEPTPTDALLLNRSATPIGPKKSILKKTHSFTMMSGGSGNGNGTGGIGAGINNYWNASPNHTPYQTVTGAESRVRLAFEAIFRKSTQLQDVTQNTNGTVQNEEEKETSSLLDQTQRPTIIPASAPIPTPTLKKVQLPRERVIDMSPEDQRGWEEEQLSQPIDMTECHIDPAPFQLVERTSLLKVHSLFSLVGISHAYVTAIGRLVGVVGLKDLRRAIEDANAGRKPQHQTINSSSTKITTTNNNNNNNNNNE